MTRKLVATAAVVLSAAWASGARAANQAPHDFAHNVTCSSCHIPSGALTDPDHRLDLAATSGTPTSLTVLTAAWTPNQWTGGVVTFTSGADRWAFRTIASNDATTLTWADALPSAVGSGDTFFVTKVSYEDIEVKCKTCHNPTGQASDEPVGGLHYTGSTDPIGCGKCHEPHNIEPNSGWSGDGLGGAGLIRQAIRRPDGSTGTIVFAPGVYVQPGGNGVCQTCHTKTQFYTQDGANQTHEVGFNCVSATATRSASAAARRAARTSTPARTPGAPTRRARRASAATPTAASRTTSASATPSPTTSTAPSRPTEPPTPRARSTAQAATTRSAIPTTTRAPGCTACSS